MITSQQPWSDSPWLAEGLVSVIPHIRYYEITLTNFEWWRKYNFLHFSSFQKKYPFPIKEVVPSIHDGSMKSKNLNSAFRRISDIRYVKLRILLDIVLVFSNFTVILQYFKNCHYFSFNRLSISFEMSERIAVEFGSWICPNLFWSSHL